jgi:hypothetical protein
MKVEFQTSFFKSLKSIDLRSRWYYRAWEFLKDDIPRFLKNVWLFRKALFSHYWFDHHGMLEFMKIALIDISDNIEVKGNEIQESRFKKVEKMRRAIQILENYNNDNYINLAEKQLGEIFIGNIEFIQSEEDPNLFEMKDGLTPEQEEHNSSVFELARKIEKEEWQEFIEIIKGPDYSKFKDDETFESQFDGTGIKSWWD